MTDSVVSLVEIVNQLRQQSLASGTALNADDAIRILRERIHNGTLAVGSMSLPDHVTDSDLVAAVEQSFGQQVLTAAAVSGLAVLLDISAQTVRLSLTLGLAIALAGILCLALTMSARQITDAARSARRAVQMPSSLESLSARSPSIARDPKPVNQRDQLVRDINRVTQPHDVRKSQSK